MYKQYIIGSFIDCIKYKYILIVRKSLNGLKITQINQMYR